MVILKLKPASGAAPSEGTAAPPAPAQPTASSTPAGPKIKLKLGGGSQSTAPAGDKAGEEAPRKKRQYNRKPKLDENGNPLPKPAPKSKKRQRDEYGEDASSPEAKRQSTFGPSGNTGIAGGLGQGAPPKLKVAIKVPSSMTTTAAKPMATPTAIKVKVQGKPPIRPPGVGYDSEAEDAEDDPAIESQFVLRMLPGPDCEILRKAIEEKTIGKSVANGGPGVYFRFLDREARRAIVGIRSRQYAAAMVDLPCIIESMKSWNKKDWVKAADIAQMLLVLGPVKNDEEAKTYPLPREVDPETHQYAHGLTPPMHWVRKRRFRPRTSYRKIEEVERAVEELLEQDKQIRDAGGEIMYEEVNAEELEESSGDEEVDEVREATGDEDAEGEADDGYDEDELAKMLEAEMGAADDLFGDEPERPTNHDVAMHALGETAESFVAPETPASNTSNPETESADDDDEGDTEEEVDEDTLAAQQELAQQKEEIAELEKELQLARDQIASTTNFVYKQRVGAKIRSLENDLKMKKAAIGMEVD